MNALDDARSHALDAYPLESCGLIVRVNHGEQYVRCGNLSDRPREHFHMDPSDYADAEELGAIVAVVHSHPDAAATPSQGDRVACEAEGHPWHIISVLHDAGDDAPHVAGVAHIAPSGYEAPYIGREFEHGLLDCWTLARDYYARERGVMLPNPSRADHWWNDGASSLYSDDAMQAAGFVAVDEKNLAPGDLILMQVRSRNQVPNHAGIYLGDGQFMHHLYGRLSTRDVYGGYWRETTRGFWRLTGDGHDAA
jgi:cell wall-associated NlpC family hydrolase